MPKCNHACIDVDAIIASMNLYKGLHAFSELTTADELAAVLGHIANSANLPTAAIKEARVALTSFSAAKWSEFSKEFGLPTKASKTSLGYFITPRFCLPPSIRLCSKILGARKTSIARSLTTMEIFGAGISAKVGLHAL